MIIQPMKRIAMALALVGTVIAATAQKITEWKELLTVVDEHQRTVY